MTKYIYKQILVEIEFLNFSKSGFSSVPRRSARALAQLTNIV